MIKQYKIRDINRNPELHKEVFVKQEDCIAALVKVFDQAIAAGADRDALKEIVANG